MKIGLTYDLRDEYLAASYSEEETAEFDRPETIAALEQALQGLGFETDRIGHVKSLVARLQNGDRWDLVFNIAEGLYGTGREAQVPALLDAYRIPHTFSDAVVCALTLHKGLTKRVVRDLGVPTADFALIEQLSDCDSVQLPFPLFAKPVAEGTSKGITKASKILDHEGLREVCAHLLEKFNQPVLVETFLPGREMTVGVVGTGDKARVLGVMEVVLLNNAEAEIYSYDNKEEYEDRVVYRLVERPLADEVARAALQAWRGLGCRDAGRLDFRLDERGVPRFLEVNPLAGLHPKRSDLCILCSLVGVAYQNLLMEIVSSALERRSKRKAGNEEDSSSVSCGHKSGGAQGRDRLTLGSRCSECCAAAVRL